MVEKSKFVESLPHTKRVVAAVIFNPERDAVLLGQRAKNIRFGGLWEFIGGKIEEGEGLWEAMIRELEEELSLKFEPKKILDILEHDLGEDIGPVQINFIECDPVGEIVLDGDFPFHDEVNWVRLEDLSGLELIGSDAKFGQKLAESFYFIES